MIGNAGGYVCVKKPLDLVTDFWFASRILWKFSKKYAAFLDIVLSIYIYCTRIGGIIFQKIRNFFKMLNNFTHTTKLLKTTKRQRSFVSDNLVSSDGKNLKRNIYENVEYFFENFHRNLEANQKSVTKSTGSKTSGFFTRSGRRRFPSYLSYLSIHFCRYTYYIYLSIFVGIPIISIYPSL